MLPSLQVFWSDNGDLVAITTEESFYILKYDPSKIDEAKENPELVTEDGITDVFSDVSLAKCLGSTICKPALHVAFILSSFSLYPTF